MSENENLEIAVLVCPHVLKSVEAAGFICKTKDGYAAACAPDCSSLVDGEGLAILGMCHLVAGINLPLEPEALPLNTQLLRSDENWTIQYFEDDAELSEGDFCLASKDHPCRSLGEGAIVLALKIGAQFVSLTLAEGTKVIPIWTGPLPEDFTRQLNGTEQRIQVPLREIRAGSKAQGIEFIAVDFLTESVDVALLV